MVNLEKLLFFLVCRMDLPYDRLHLPRHPRRHGRHGHQHGRHRHDLSRSLHRILGGLLRPHRAALYLCRRGQHGRQNKVIIFSSCLKIDICTADCNVKGPSTLAFFGRVIVRADLQMDALLCQIDAKLNRTINLAQSRVRSRARKCEQKTRVETPLTMPSK
jgi:hypothetical protein